MTRDELIEALKWTAKEMRETSEAFKTREEFQDLADGNAKIARWAAEAAAMLTADAREIAQLRRSVEHHKTSLDTFGPPAFIPHAEGTSPPANPEGDPSK